MTFSAPCCMVGMAWNMIICSWEHKRMTYDEVAVLIIAGMTPRHAAGTQHPTDRRCRTIRGVLTAEYAL